MEKMLAFTHFLTQFTHVSRHPQASSKTVLKCGLGNPKEEVIWPQNPQKIVDIFMFFLVKKKLFLKVVVWTHGTFVHKSETTFLKQSSLNNYFCFLKFLDTLNREPCYSRAVILEGNMYSK